MTTGSFYSRWRQRWFTNKFLTVYTGWSCFDLGFDYVFSIRRFLFSQIQMYSFSFISKHFFYINRNVIARMAQIPELHVSIYILQDACCHIAFPLQMSKEWYHQLTCSSFFCRLGWTVFQTLVYIYYSFQDSSKRWMFNRPNETSRYAYILYTISAAAADVICFGTKAGVVPFDVVWIFSQRIVSIVGMVIISATLFQTRKSIDYWLGDGSMSVVDANWQKSIKFRIMYRWKNRMQYNNRFNGRRIEEKTSHRAPISQKRTPSTTSDSSRKIK